MNCDNHLTTGSVAQRLIQFAMPYLLAAFMQTFYGMTDLFVVGWYHGSECTTAVSVGSQVMHMITVVILGFAMGTTVNIGRSVGAHDAEGVHKTIGTSIFFFAGVAAVLTVILILCTDGIVHLMLTPAEAIRQTRDYLRICFAGIPFITAYNVISSMFRGMGDSKRPMYFVGIACVINVVLDFLLIGYFHMGAAGAAYATIIGQFVSVIAALCVMRKQKAVFGDVGKNLTLHREELGKILLVGAPIALQDGMIQVAFIVITVIANSRGLVASASVGIVEKIIGFLFLVPSAFMSAISAITAQNIGAGKRQRARKTLYYGLMVTMGWGLLCTIYSQFLPETLVGLFTKDAMVLMAGCAYLRSYSADTFFAAIHFCFSGYFCGEQKSLISFIHNILSILLIRIPGAYLTSLWFPTDLFPMGCAAPLGSLLSAVICVGYFWYSERKVGEVM